MGCEALSPVEDPHASRVRSPVVGIAAYVVTRPLFFLCVYLMFKFLSQTCFPQASISGVFLQLNEKLQGKFRAERQRTDQRAVSGPPGVFPRPSATVLVRSACSASFSRFSVRLWLAC